MSYDVAIVTINMSNIEEDNMSNEHIIHLPKTLINEYKYLNDRLDKTLIKIKQRRASKQ